MRSSQRFRFWHRPESTKYLDERPVKINDSNPIFSAPEMGCQIDASRQSRLAELRVCRDFQTEIHIVPRSQSHRLTYFIYFRPKNVPEWSIALHGASHALNSPSGLYR